MNELIKVDFEKQTVSARELHRTLGIEKRFSVWFENNAQGFVEGEDYRGAYLKVQGNQYGGEQEIQDYACSVDMAKHICLMSRTEKGKQCRQYLIDLEKKWNTPELVMARALKLADQRIKSLENVLEEQKPLVEFAESVSQSADTVDMSEMAKIAKDENINIGRNRLIDWMREQKYLMPSKAPYQKYVDAGYMKLVNVPKRTIYGERVYQKTVFTGKGQMWIMDKLRKEYKA